MSSSFGDWYEQQKADKGDGNGSNSANGSGNFLTGIMSGDNMAESLPLFFGEGGALNSIPNIDISGTLEAQLPQKVMGMNYQQRFKVFIISLFISSLFFGLAFFVGLPLVTVRPQKFALCFTLGSLSFMCSFAILKGPHAHMASMLAYERLPFTTVYLTSMFATLYFTFTVGGMSGYVAVMGASGLQLASLMWYLVTFIPGGTNGLKLVVSGMIKMLQPVLIVLRKCCTQCLSLCLSWCTRR
mmetsp:Transcript_16829/g.26250  ORF Transcript_16829/g.26250 Transcript_16829/m.26250 type:complete len:242 (-) Transcript_16829:321-1046(-)|eukprot:CAMPEP_0196820818 /NCGR_PEP_ID=MMETSP1362-20130617/76741_1 /TAXON_ID=163516 /ORGANISM="Leptocylindrus danicus, Strain CCMP1856" /LENGTH=241 /DNA_ID=CAMNT_0042199821 /DNA_START=146 /DNA_END=871 /DNA_ORIENTATION=+